MFLLRRIVKAILTCDYSVFVTTEYYLYWWDHITNNAFRKYLYSTEVHLSIVLYNTVTDRNQRLLHWGYMG